MSVIRSQLVYGFTLQSVEVKLLAYADGIAVYCADTKSVSEVLSLARNICAASGAALNLEKKLWGFLRPVGCSFD